ncbi:Ger(x)C family spore germination protein [Paenibacillus sp. CGMCC 1.16610]|uniref:Ger(X)C family spore germination protein n=1 Tax=Paenibacillus anseongense TaxID=2682845 RepID=A0ABW9UEI1_9BACL|nr:MULTISPECIES: Ger(x)C family spore germination protein [Paenibacillus]MBA2943796.1 Ger(x)C family spore germination protein [Paenibacillus sp. CGMCC 1.16610]MVQ37685.1 Ger(x)C family spore germination protein [Paenibacillus anseongense]
MKRLGRILCTLSLLGLVLSGCWDRHELNDLAITVGVGLDKSGDEYLVTVQIVNPNEVASKKGAGYSTPITTLSARGISILEAARKLTTSAPRKLFASHLRIIVIGEELAREGVAKVLDGITRDHEIRSDFYLIVARGTTASKVLQILTPIERIPANKMFKTLETSEKAWAPTVSVRIDQFITKLSEPTTESVLTGIRIEGDPKKGRSKSSLAETKPITNLQYTGLALFKQDKLVDWLNEDESKGYNYIVGNVKSTMGHLECPKGGTLTVEIIRSKTKMKGVVKNGKPEINLHVILEENVSEVQCDIDLLKPETIHELEETATKALKKVMYASINKAKENKADIFGFGEVIEDVSPKLWKEMEPDWQNEFAKLQVNISADLHIRRLGTTNNSIIMRREEE